MENADDEDDLKLIKASAGLLSDLEHRLPRLLWKKTEYGIGHGRVHTQIRSRDLEHVIKLIEPFQGEPQLLDARLKCILPPIVEAYLEYLSLSDKSPSKHHLNFQSAVCTLLYILCKVRGQKVIVGFLSNEPRYFEAVLSALERVSIDSSWQVPYVLLLWLSHLLLTPFDLATISNTQAPVLEHSIEDLPDNVPPLTTRVLNIGLKYLPKSTKSQDAAAAMLVRLVTRPDMQRFGLADSLVAAVIKSMTDGRTAATSLIYERLGPLRFISGVASSVDLPHLVPHIYQTSERLASDDTSWVSSNAVAKKAIVKIFRNVAILSLRSASASGADALLDFLRRTNVLEDVIDYLLRSLGDRDTPVRYAAAKALSLIILELESEMGHEVIQAVLDMFKEDMLRDGAAFDFRTANALKWHGLTLTLAHTLFKRSAAREQLNDLVDALVFALQFQQRTATGSSVGTNVRDAANFGIWSLSRRYTTPELLGVDTGSLQTGGTAKKHKQTVIQFVATQLILSACFDPAGNIRRGSSAALQELIGRHSNQVYDGIALVQVVDYQAVGLRRRAMVDVAMRASQLHETYWAACLDALLGWRGLGSADVPSREAAAASLSELSSLKFDAGDKATRTVLTVLARTPSNDVEDLHGLVLSLSLLLNIEKQAQIPDELLKLSWNVSELLETATRHHSPRLLRSELLSAVARLLSALCACQVDREPAIISENTLQWLEALTERILTRHEDSVLQIVPFFARNLFALGVHNRAAMGCIEEGTLANKVSGAATKSTLTEAGKAIALGALVPLYDGGLHGGKAIASLSTLSGLVSGGHVEWRVIGVKAIQLIVEAVKETDSLSSELAMIIIDAIHQGLNDYTVDERGDIGSLVRLQAISCTIEILLRGGSFGSNALLGIIHADISRLSLEKLDRVRLAAAQCRHRFLDFQAQPNDIASISSYSYFLSALEPLTSSIAPAWQHVALLEGIISSAGTSSESLLQASRSALLHHLSSMSLTHLHQTLTLFSSTLKIVLLERSQSTTQANQSAQALSLLAFLLDMEIPQRLLLSPGPTSQSFIPRNPAESSNADDALEPFKWLTLLSTIQKSHHKSPEIPRLLAAVHVYQGLAQIPAIRGEVLKKLAGMVRTNPFPRVRVAAAEALFVCTGWEGLLVRDWMAKVGDDGKKVLEELLVTEG